jgi:hypothetical protein
MREGEQGRGFSQLPTTQSNTASEAICKIRNQFNEALERQADQIAELTRTLQSLQSDQRRLEEAAFQLLEPLESSPTPDAVKCWSPSGILASVRRLASASCAGQVLEFLVDEAAQMNVRSVVFDVRGGAAWASAASGFEPELPADGLRTLAVPLSHDGPFGRVVEASEPVETDSTGLENYGHVLAKLNPSARARILLAPVRSAGAVAAILYADLGETRNPNIFDVIKVLAEFAGAHMDRLMLRSAGLAATGIAHAKADTDSEPEVVAVESQSSVEVSLQEADEPTEGQSDEVLQPEASVAAEAQLAEAPEAGRAAAFMPTQEEAVLPAAPEVSESPGELQAATDAPAMTPHPEEERVHRDAKRFSKLLVSEIELYNRSGVEEGRRNKDLYQRLKKDIDRSRETYEKRFGHTVAKQVDYFHEELVRTLAQNDPALLGPDYPGPMA